MTMNLCWHACRMASCCPFAKSIPSFPSTHSIAFSTLMAGKTRFSTRERSRQSSRLPVPLNYSKMTSSMRLPVSTSAVAMIGEIGGTDEQVAAEFVRDSMSKPVVGFIAGRTAPPGRRMGHAGAIISGSEGTAEEKMRAFRECGIEVAELPADFVGLIRAGL